MKKIITTAPIVILMITLFVSCGTGGLNGTYVPKNEAAKKSMFSKFVFKGNKVKCYMGMMGMSLASYEYSYSVNGTTVSLEAGIPGAGAGGVEFTYNKGKNELSLFNGMLDGAVDEFVPVWGKEGTFDPNNPYPDKKNPDDTTGEPNNSYDKNESCNYNLNSYSQELAETCALYSAKVYNENDIRTEFLKDGFIKLNYYDNKEDDGIGYMIAHKICNETLLAVVIRGTIGNEWRGNMDIGESPMGGSPHKSFQKANEALQNAIVRYIKDNNLKNINFLITGHSRGGAVANLLAVDLNDGTSPVTEMKKIAAYTFATPNNIKDFTAYNNIFNFCFEDDFVTQVPLGKWGYGKSGKTYKAVAAGLYHINPDFKNLVSNHYFNYKATQSVLQAVYNTAPTINDYYHKKLQMGMHVGNFLEEDKTLYGFMRDYVAQAMIDVQNGKTWYNCTSIPGLGAKAAISAGNDVHEIADFFVDVENFRAEQYIADTHEMWTYYYALIANGFLTK
jgi:hypothetical protein